MDLYQALIANQYTGLVQLKPISAPGTWLGDGNAESLFPLTTVLTKWDVRRGGGGYNYGNQHDIYSNWIFGTVAGHQNCVGQHRVTVEAS